jgi:hypothetical protein
MASRGGGSRRLVASRGGDRAGDIQSRRPEFGGRGAGLRLREAGSVGGWPVERVGWRSGQGRRAVVCRAGQALAWGGRAMPALADGVRASGRGSSAGAGHRPGSGG